jgi:hypothetical protein
MEIKRAGKNKRQNSWAAILPSCKKLNAAPRVQYSKNREGITILLLDGLFIGKNK